MKDITLNSGVVVRIPEKFEYAKCKGCDKDDIVWATTRSGNSMPIRWDEGKGWISHFSDCPKANNFRNNKPKHMYKPSPSGNRMEFPQEIVRAIRNSQEEQNAARR